MKTIQEILRETGSLDYDSGGLIVSGYTRDIFPEIEKYTKQVALAFDRFKRDNIYTIDADGETYHKLIIEGDKARTEQYSFEEVYTQFIEHQSHNK